MSEIGEGLGAAIEGGLAARAVEPAHGQPPRQSGHGHFAEQECLNCGTRLVGSHCHACGQQAHLHRTIGAFLHDLVHGALHLDGKTWRTLPMLIAKPGALTRRYIAGERARFVSPMALFLFSIFLMFAVFQLTGISAPTEINTPGLDLQQVKEAQERARTDTAAERARLEKERASLRPGSPRIAAIEGELENLDKADAIIGSAGALASGNKGKANEVASFSDNKTGIAWLDHAVEKWRKNPALMLYKLQSNFYKFSWLLIPLSLPFVWLLFLWKRQFNGYDHAVFITYSLSFMTLLFIALALASFVGVASGWVVAALVLIPPIHLYKQLRHAYGLSRLSTLWRLVALTVFISVILVLFLQMLLLFGLMG